MAAPRFGTQQRRAYDAAWDVFRKAEDGGATALELRRMLRDRFLTKERIRISETQWYRGVRAFFGKPLRALKAVKDRRQMELYP